MGGWSALSLLATALPRTVELDGEFGEVDVGRESVCPEGDVEDLLARGHVGEVDEDPAGHAPVRVRCLKKKKFAGVGSGFGVPERGLVEVGGPVG